MLCSSCPLEDELIGAGFDPVMCINGASAIAKLDEPAALYKAVLIDVRLGEGPDGWEVARHARHLAPDIP